MKMKKIVSQFISLALVLLMLVSMVPAESLTAIAAAIEELKVESEINSSPVGATNYDLLVGATGITTVTFDPNGGTLSNPGANLYNATNPSNVVNIRFGSGDYYNMGGDIPTRSGYTFTGWYTAKTGGEQVYDAQGVCVTGTYWASTKSWQYRYSVYDGGDLTVYAQWTASTYTITFDKQGGSGGTNSVQVAQGSAMPTISVPTRPGYTFGGYYLTMAGINGSNHTRFYYEASGASEKTWDLSSNETLYAHWVGNTHTLLFDKNGGNGGTDSVTVTCGSAMPTITVPTRQGYTFNGYYATLPEKDDLGNITVGVRTCYYKADGTGGTWFTNYYPSGVQITLTAQWTANKYTVTLNRNNGSGGTASVTATYGSAMPSATMPSRTGYTFAGYYDATSGGTQYYTAAGASARAWNKTANTTLYARWTANKYTVTLNRNNGSGGTASVTATYGSAMPSATMPTRTGYTFAGYYDATSGGTQYYTAAGASARAWNKAANTTLYARWTVVTYSVTYNLNGGSLSSQVTSYNIASAAFTLGTPTKTGYTFTGWTGSNGNTPQKTVTIATGSTGNKSYTANWTANTYTVTLNRNNASGGTASVTATYGSAMPSATMPYRTGYTFAGYYDTSAASGGTQYYTAAGASARTWNKTANTTLYARWKANTYTIAYNAMGGTGAPASQSSTGTNSINISSTKPTKTGYTFVGWSPSLSTYNSWYTSGQSVSMLGGTLYAVWKPNAPKITTSNYVGGKKVVLSNDAGLTIYYTTDGTNPTTSSTKYTAPFVVSNGTTVKAIAERASYGDMTTYPTSDVSSSTISITATATPTITVSNITGGKSATITCSTSGATIYYTTNGTNPTTGSTKYTGAINFTSVSTTTIKAIAVASGYTQSAVGSGTVTVTKLPTPSITAPNGGIGYVNVVMSCSANCPVYYTTNGTNPTASSTRYTGSFNTTETVTYKAIAIQAGYVNSDVATLKVSVNQVATPTITATNTTAQKTVTLACSTSGATIYYTLDGTNPSNYSTKYTGPFTVDRNVQVKAIAYCNMYKTSAVATSSITVDYTVTYNLNGGTIASTVNSYNIASASFTLGTPTKTGYTFTGWTGSNGNTPQTSVTVATGSTGNKTFTANWTAKTYQLTFDPNGGTLPNPGDNLYNKNPANSVTVTYDSIVYYGMLNDIPTKTGYTFAGWYTAKTGGTQVYDAQGFCIPGTSYWNSSNQWIYDGNLTVYAQWTAKSYQLTFDPNGGTLPNSSNMVTVTYTSGNNYYVDWAIPTKTGYIFAGWYTAKTGGEQVYDDRGVCVAGNYWNSDNGWIYDGNLTVYAQWIAKTVTVTFYRNHSTSDTTTNVQTFTYGVPGNAFADTGFTKTGYTLTNWYENADCTTSQVYSTLSEVGDNWIDGSYPSKSLYAKWTPNTYTVTLDGNGATTAGTASVTATYDSAMPSATMPSRTGYIFEGYYDTSATSGGTQYYSSNGSSVKDWDKTENTTLYARWIANSYNITYVNKLYNVETSVITDLNKTVGGMESLKASAEYATTINLSNVTLTCPEYVFIGWYSDEELTTVAFNGTDDIIVKDNMTLYAKWIAVGTITISEEDKYVSIDEISMQKSGFELYGTQIRFAAPNGLRFLSRMRTDLLTEIASETGKSSVTYGYAMRAQNTFAQNNYDMSVLKLQEIDPENLKYADFGEYFIYTVVINYSNSKNFGVNFSSAPYIQYIDANNNQKIYYTTERATVDSESLEYKGVYHTTIRKVAQRYLDLEAQGKIILGNKHITFINEILA